MIADGAGQGSTTARKARLPFFDPWADAAAAGDEAGSGAGADPGTDRGSAAAAVGGSDEAAPSDTAEPGPPAPGTDPAGFLRHEAVPMLTRLVRRLQLSGHSGTVQDLLDLPTTPALRLLVWPRRPLMDSGSVPTRATLEVEVAGSREPAIDVHYWWGPEKGSVVHLARLPAEALTTSWLWDRLLDGLRQVLDSA